MQLCFLNDPLRDHISGPPISWNRFIMKLPELDIITLNITLFGVSLVTLYSGVMTLF